VPAFDRGSEEERWQRPWRTRAASLKEQQEPVRREISVAETGAAGGAAAGFVVVVAAGQEDQWAEEENVRVGLEESLVLGEGTSLEEEDRRTEEEDHWGSREDQREDRSESCPVEVEGSRTEGTVGVVEGPEDLEDRATVAAAAAVVVAVGWAGGRRPEGQMAVLEERRVRRGVLRPERVNVSVDSRSCS
jgi:hypothetical protein